MKKREIIMELLDRIGNMCPDYILKEVEKTYNTNVNKELYERAIERSGDVRQIRKEKIKKISNKEGVK